MKKLIHPFQQKGTVQKSNVWFGRLTMNIDIDRIHNFVYHDHGAQNKQSIPPNLAGATHGLVKKGCLVCHAPWPALRPVKKGWGRRFDILQNDSIPQPQSGPF